MERMTSSLRWLKTVVRERTTPYSGRVREWRTLMISASVRRASPGRTGDSPAHLFDAGADHAAGDVDGFDAEAHDDGGGEPAGGGEAFEEGALAGGLVDVEGLRVVALAELLDLLGRDLVGAAGVEGHAWVQVFEVEFFVAHVVSGSS